jgi:hypothetical protein
MNLNRGSSHFPPMMTKASIFPSAKRFARSASTLLERKSSSMAEVLVVRSARKREDLQRQKVEISDYKGLYIQVGSARAPDPVHEIRERLARVGKRSPETSPSPDSAPEIRQRVFLRLPRRAGLEISEIGDVGLRFDGEVNADLDTWSIAGAIKPDLQNVGIRYNEPVWAGLKARIGAGGRRSR